MSYTAKTNWQGNDPVTEYDLNRWENGILAAHQQIEALRVQVTNETDSKLSNIVGDLTKLTFQLAITNVASVQGMKHVFVDQITAANSVDVTTGYYASGGIQL
ncbi:hypothetical protein [Exiguobacterium sp. S22-S28]|uniref:hypothetical protein n=1 Tax=Exiguobacterium sp. S22-S28 TaxID=3342768 RepID=UPI00372D73C7